MDSAVLLGFSRQRAVAEARGAKTIIEPDVGRAVERAQRLASPDDAILVTGSLYVVGAARTQLVSTR